MGNIVQYLYYKFEGDWYVKYEEFLLYKEMREF